LNQHRKEKSQKETIAASGERGCQAKGKEEGDIRGSMLIATICCCQREELAGVKAILLREQKGRKADG